MSCMQKTPLRFPKLKPPSRLFIMLRPKVAAAFRGEAASPQIEDYYDTDRTERLDQP